MNDMYHQGPFGWTRNPLYVGAVTALTGAGLALDNSLTMTAAVSMLAYCHFVAIPVEEKLLARLFGHAFDDYCSRVPRWLI